MAWLTFDWKPIALHAYAETLGDAYYDLWTVGIDPEGGWSVSKNRVHLSYNFASKSEAKRWVEAKLVELENS